MTRPLTILWHDVRERFTQLADGGGWKSQPTLERHGEMWRSSRKDGWNGGSLDDTRRWLAEGYHSPLFATQDLAPQRNRRRRRAHWSADDGDVDVGRLYGGSDEFYLTRGARDSRPGMTVEVEYAFASIVGAKVIEQYGAWVASLIGTLESKGYDLEVALSSTVDNAWARGSERMVTRVVVKQRNEVSDFASWSVLFSPTGFRHLFFTALGLAGDQAKRQCHATLGTPITSGWSVKVEDGTIRIGCDRRGSGDPQSILTAKAQEAGLL